MDMSNISIGAGNPANSASQGSGASQGGDMSGLSKSFQEAKAGEAKAGGQPKGQDAKGAGGTKGAGGSGKAGAEGAEIKQLIQQLMQMLQQLTEGQGGGMDGSKGGGKTGGGTGGGMDGGKAGGGMDGGKAGGGTDGSKGGGKAGGKGGGDDLKDPSGGPGAGKNKNEWSFGASSGAGSGKNDVGPPGVDASAKPPSGDELVDKMVKEGKVKGPQDLVGQLKQLANEDPDMANALKKFDEKGSKLDLVNSPEKKGQWGGLATPAHNGAPNKVQVAAGGKDTLAHEVNHIFDMEKITSGDWHDNRFNDNLKKLQDGKQTGLV
jgi:hypothetical protein